MKKDMEMNGERYIKHLYSPYYDDVNNIKKSLSLTNGVRQRDAQNQTNDDYIKTTIQSILKERIMELQFLNSGQLRNRLRRMEEENFNLRNRAIVLEERIAYLEKMLNKSNTGVQIASPIARSKLSPVQCPVDTVTSTDVSYILPAGESAIIRVDTYADRGNTSPPEETSIIPRAVSNNALHNISPLGESSTVQTVSSTDVGNISPFEKSTLTRSISVTNAGNTSPGSSTITRPVSSSDMKNTYPAITTVSSTNIRNISPGTSTITRPVSSANVGNISHAISTSAQYICSTGIRNVSPRGPTLTRPVSSANDRNGSPSGKPLISQNASSNVDRIISSVKITTIGPATTTDFCITNRPITTDMYNSSTVKATNDRPISSTDVGNKSLSGKTIINRPISGEAYYESNRPRHSIPVPSRDPPVLPDVRTSANSAFNKPNYYPPWESQNTLNENHPGNTPGTFRNSQIRAPYRPIDRGFTKEMGNQRVNQGESRVSNETISNNIHFSTPNSHHSRSVPVSSEFSSNSIKDSRMNNSMPLLHQIAYRPNEINDRRYREIRPKDGLISSNPNETSYSGRPKETYTGVTVNGYNSNQQIPIGNKEPYKYPNSNNDIQLRYDINANVPNNFSPLSGNSLSRPLKRQQTYSGPRPDPRLEYEPLSKTTSKPPPLIPNIDLQKAPLNYPMINLEKPVSTNYHPPPYASQLALPQLTAQITSDKSSIILTWDKVEKKQIYLENVKVYFLFAFHTLDLHQPPPKDITFWRRISIVNPLPLPIACTLTQSFDGQNYFFAVAAVDKNGRVGELSNPCALKVAL